MGEGEFEFDEGRLLGGEFDEVLGVPDSPAGTFETILLVLIRLSSLASADDIVVLAAVRAYVRSDIPAIIGVANCGRRPGPGEDEPVVP